MTVTFELILQLLVIMALGAFVPLRLARLLPWRLSMVPVNILVSALLLWLAGMAMMAMPYLLRGDAVVQGLRSDPAGGIGWLARQGLLPVIAWAPILGLTTLGIAQRIAQHPHRTGQDR